MDFALLVCDAFWTGSPIALRSAAHFGFLVFVLSKARSGALVFVLDSACLDFTFLLACHGRFGLSLSTFGMLRAGRRGLFVEDFAQMELLLPLRALGQLGLLMPVFGLVCLGFVVLLVDYLRLGSSLLLRSCAWLGASVLSLSFSFTDFSLPIRSLA